MASRPIQKFDKLTSESIAESKYVLNTALIEALRDRDPEDVKSLKETMFWVLEQTDDMFEPIKYSIIDGRFLDAAEQMYLLADRHQKAGTLGIPQCGDLFFKAGILFKPFVMFRALSCFENALGTNASPKLCNAELAQIYRRLGDVTRAVKHEMLSMGANAQTVRLAGVSVDNDKPNQPYAANVAVLPITLLRDDEERFSHNLDLK